MKYITSDFTFEFSAFSLLIVAILFYLIFRLIKKISKKNELDDQEKKTIKKRRKNTIAVVRVRGVILDDKKDTPLASEMFATFGATVKDKLQQLAEDDRVVATLLIFTTPGGTVPGSIMISEGIETFKQSGKPIVGLISGMSCSGGVKAMVSCDSVYALEGSLTGSIGVVGPTLHQFTNVTSLGDGGIIGGSTVEATIESFVMEAGKGKAFGNPFGKDNHESRENFKGIIDRAYNYFVNHVAKAREIDAQALKDFGAHIMDISQAKNIGLIDGVQTFDGILEEIAMRVSLPLDDCNVEEQKSKATTLISKIFEALQRTDLHTSTQVSSDALVNAELNKQPILVVSPLHFKS